MWVLLLKGFLQSAFINEGQKNVLMGLEKSLKIPKDAMGVMAQIK